MKPLCEIVGNWLLQSATENEGVSEVIYNQSGMAVQYVDSLFEIYDCTGNLALHVKDPATALAYLGL